MKKISFLFALLVGCSLLQSVKPPEVTFVNAVPHDFTIAGFKVDIKLQVKNPNSFPVNLDKMDVLLFINDKKTASTEFVNVALKANDTSPLDATVVINYADAGFAIASALQSTSAVKFRIDAVAHYKTPLGELKIPVTMYKH